MAGHPAGNPDADGGKLALPDPHTGQARYAFRLDLVVSRDADQNVLEIANVAVHVATVGLEIEDWVAHELAGPVISHLAATVGFSAP